MGTPSKFIWIGRQIFKSLVGSIGAFSVLLDPHRLIIYNSITINNNHNKLKCKNILILATIVVTSIGAFTS